MAEEQITADQIGVGNTIKHPDTGEWVKVTDTKLFGQSGQRSEPQAGEPSREWTGYYITVDPGGELKLRFEDQVTRRTD